MPNKTSLRTLPRPAKPRRSDSTALSVGIPTSSVHHDQLISIVDPFSDAAGTAKIPDLGAGRTQSESIRFAGTVSSNANGNAYFSIAPKLNFPFLYSSNSTAWDSTYSGGIQNTTSMCYSQGSEFRITSYGIRLVSLFSATDAKGAIVLATGQPVSVSGSVVLTPDSYSDYHLSSIGDDSEWHMVGVPDSAESLDWTPVTSASTNIQGPVEGWNTLYILATGMPVSTAAFQMEIVVNVEFKFLQGSTLQKFASPQPVYNPQMLVARNEAYLGASKVIKGSKDVVAKHLKQEAHKALTKHVFPFLAKKGAKLAAGLLV